MTPASMLNVAGPVRPPPRMAVSDWHCNTALNIKREHTLAAASEGHNRPLWVVITADAALSQSQSAAYIATNSAASEHLATPLGRQHRTAARTWFDIEKGGPVTVFVHSEPQARQVAVAGRFPASKVPNAKIPDTMKP